MIEPNPTLVERALRRELIIPDWQSFTRTLSEIYHEVSSNRTGVVASYIPELAQANPEWFALSFMSIDGQQFNLGDVQIEFSAQSSSKVRLYNMFHLDLPSDRISSLLLQLLNSYNHSRLFLLDLSGQCPFCLCCVDILLTASDIFDRFRGIR